MLAEDGHAARRGARADRRRGRRGAAGLIKRAEIEGRYRRHRGGHPGAPGHLPPGDGPARGALRRRGLLVQVDGMGEVDEVTDTIDQAWRPEAVSSAPDVRPVPHRDQDPRADRCRMRRAGLVVGQTLQLIAQTVRPGHDDQGPGRAGRGAHPRQRRQAVVPGLPRLHRLAVHLGQRRGRARHPGLTGAARGRPLSIDCGAIVDGWHGDAAISVIVGGRGAGRAEDLALIDATEDSMWAGIAAARGGRAVCMPWAPLSRTASIAAPERPAARVRHRRGLRRPRHRHRDAHGPAGAQLRRPRQGPAAGRSGVTRRHRADGHPRHRRDHGCSRTTGRSSPPTARRAAHWENTVAVTDQGLWVLTALDGGRASGWKPPALRRTPPADRVV